MSTRGLAWIMRACGLVALAVAVFAPLPVGSSWLSRAIACMFSVGAGVCFAGASAALDAQRRADEDMRRWREARAEGYCPMCCRPDEASAPERVS